MPIFFIPSSTTIIYTLALHDALPISEFFLQVANQCGVLGTKGKGLGKKYLLCGGAATLYACHKALVENALMGPALVNHHQSRFNRCKDVFVLELEKSGVLHGAVLLLRVQLLLPGRCMEIGRA